MHISEKSRKKLLALILKINEGMDNHEMRSQIGYMILDLFDADFYGSYGWDSDNESFCDGVYLNLDPDNHSNYLDYYQYIDPIAAAIKESHSAVRSTEVIEYRSLIKTEFYNDFLNVDGLNKGLELRIFDENAYLGDFRIWRKKGISDFDDEYVGLLELLKPHLRNALKKNNQIRIIEQAHKLPFNSEEYLSRHCDHYRSQLNLTSREWQIAIKLTSGKGDKAITQIKGHPKT